MHQTQRIPKVYHDVLKSMGTLFQSFFSSKVIRNPKLSLAMVPLPFDGIEEPPKAPEGILLCECSGQWYDTGFLDIIGTSNQFTVSKTVIRSVITRFIPLPTENLEEILR